MSIDYDFGDADEKTLIHIISPLATAIVFNALKNARAAIAQFGDRAPREMQSLSLKVEVSDVASGRQLTIELVNWIAPESIQAFGNRTDQC